MQNYQNIKDNEDFIKSYENAQRVQRQIIRNLRIRSELQEQSSKSAKIDQNIRKDIKELDTEVQIMERLLKKFNEDPDKYKITEKEIQRRNNIYTQLKQCYEQDCEQFRCKILPKQSEQIQIQSEIISNVQPKNQNANYIEMQQLAFRKQNDHLDEIDHQVQQIQVKTKTIHTTVKEDLILLKEFEKNVDQTENKMQKTSRKFQNFLLRTSNCCLFMTIAIELVIFVILICL